ncbi:MAG TPA: hypothetical protein VLA71_04245 [Algoriphagus sp.]|nr:hypothetical protein [Algoriphagus sp.]
MKFLLSETGEFVWMLGKIFYNFEVYHMGNPTSGLSFTLGIQFS